MSPDEIRTRLAMLARQHIDTWQASRGHNPLNPHPAVNRSGIPSFFFDAGAAPALAAQIQSRMPGDAAGVIESARRVSCGQFDLLGFRGLSFGAGVVDWHLDAVHGVRASNVPWFRVPYLVFHHVGDHKITWELSRHQHLMLLARAWLFTGDPEFLAVLERYWRDWRQANPYPFGINWSSALEVAFRALSWIWIDHLTAGSPGISADLRSAIQLGIGESAVYIERYISTYFAPNTHLLGEALALFFVGVLYPQFERSAFWRDYGWKIVLQESGRQVRPDGFHFEQSVYYHVYALEMFLYGRILAARNGIPIPAAYDETIIRMADGLAAVAAGGQAPRFGDDDGGRLFDGRRNRPEHMLDPLAAAAIVYGRGDWKARSGGLREETVWLLGLSAVQAFDALPDDPQPPRSRAFPASGYHVMPSADGVAVIDAGPHGWGRGGHGHADALSLQLLAHGRAWLTDPGTCWYPKEKPERDRFRATAAHNTLEVDGLSQAEPIHSFAWRFHPVTTVKRWYEGRQVTIFQGSHNGFERLAAPVTHARTVIAWPDGLWFVRDAASGQGDHRLDLRWHFMPDCREMPDEAARRFTDGVDSLWLATASGQSWTPRCESAQWSPAYGVAVDAPVLRLSYEGPLPAECATLIGWNNRSCSLVCDATGEGVSAFLYRHPGRARLILFATSPEKWRFCGMESDAEVLVMEWSDAEVTHLLRVGETCTHINGEAITTPPPVDGVAEWSFQNGGFHAPTFIAAVNEQWERRDAGPR